MEKWIVDYVGEHGDKIAQWLVGVSLSLVFAFQALKRLKVFKTLKLAFSEYNHYQMSIQENKRLKWLFKVSRINDLAVEGYDYVIDRIRHNHISAREIDEVIRQTTDKMKLFIGEAKNDIYASTGEVINICFLNTDKARFKEQLKEIYLSDAADIDKVNAVRQLKIEMQGYMLQCIQEGEVKE